MLDLPCSLATVVSGKILTSVVILPVTIVLVLTVVDVFLVITEVYAGEGVDVVASPGELSQLDMSNVDEAEGDVDDDETGDNDDDVGRCRCVDMDVDVDVDFDVDVDVGVDVGVGGGVGVGGDVDFDVDVDMGVGVGGDRDGDVDMGVEGMEVGVPTDEDELVAGGTVEEVDRHVPQSAMSQELRVYSTRVDLIMCGHRRISANT